MDIDIDKLERLFKAKYESLVVDENPDATYENWVGYCDGHEIFLLHPEWLVDSLNDNAMKGMVCIHTPEEDRDASPWLLVPRKFAERALILGGLP
jgi:hypothetical protein